MFAKIYFANTQTLRSIGNLRTIVLRVQIILKIFEFVKNIGGIFIEFGMHEGVMIVK